MWSAAASAGQPPVERLPPPRVVAPAPPLTYPGVYRDNPYDVWRFYAVDRRGNFRPVVVYHPGGFAYRLVDGKPYPWVQNLTQQQVIVSVSNPAVMPLLWMPPACE
jgi:hypothetical protein